MMPPHTASQTSYTLRQILRHQVSYMILLVVIIRYSHTLFVLFGKWMTTTPFPTFAVLLSSSTGSNRKASNRYGGKCTCRKKIENKTILIHLLRPISLYVNAVNSSIYSKLFQMRHHKVLHNASQTKAKQSKKRQI